MLPVLGNRMSSLPVTQFCGQAGILGSMGSGRSAAQSSAFHALCAKAENANELVTRLTDEEYQEMLSWKHPGDVDLGNGHVLRYADAETEVEVAIDDGGSYVDPKSPKAISIGHLDFAWVVVIHGVKLAYVADIKRSEFTTKEGPNSLQLHGYGLAYAGKHECDGYVTGIWAAVEGTWQWGEIVDLETREAVTLAKRVIAAAMNVSPEYSMGPHCRDCYGRLRCPAWLLPPEVAQTSLAPVAQGQELTDESAGKLLLTLQRYQDTAKAVEANLREYAARVGGIRHNGQIWKPVLCQGRESVSIARVREAFGEDADRVITRGKPFEQFRWTKEA
jgi:hypothetical protein